ncbi:hypothetical protein DIZ27_11720 [Streptomyces sp. NWU339]|nr:hypothetical protein DIZ27_11720 [Streptomyces sp. NWU339]
MWGPADGPKDSGRKAMHVHGRTGEACPVRGDTVREVSFADSSLQHRPTRRKPEPSWLQPPLTGRRP